MLTGRRVGAAEASAIGLVSRVVPDATLDDEVEAVVAGLASAAPLAVRQGKRSFWQLQDTGTSAVLTAMQEELTRLTRTEDAAEGIAAFRERRQPRWQGR
jgi:enoyl-CoA hydratase/carnithine racemase